MLQRELGAWRLATFQREVAFVKSAISGGKILDIGCAGGEFLSMFSKDGWECYGIEPSLTAVEQAKSRGFQIFQGVLQTAATTLPDAYFNVITYLDALTFSPTPVEDLLLIHRLLADDGVLVIEIPGLLFRLLRNVGPVSWIEYRKWCHLSSISLHLFYYSDNSFRKLLKIGGFGAEKIMLEQSPIRASRLMTFVNELYFAASRLIYRITLGKLNLAAKVVYLCRKI